MARYFTTTLPYVNSNPHIGFAVEVVQADVLARTARASGEDVFFTTGSDEHGQKIAQKANEAGKDVQEYVDHYAGEFEKLKKTLNLSYDNFIRTTDKKHIDAAKELWKLCEKNGDIYKKSYKGLYCVGDEMFLRESDLVDGKCINHPDTEPVEIEEENYFFALSKYQKYIEEYLAKEVSVVPEWRRKEALNFVKSGLEDFSISREKKRLSWGISVPDDDTQVMYVWFDALTNYISTLGWPEDKGGNFKKFWENGVTMQLAGKDQVRFQSIMWQAMLRSAGISATDTVLYHGFINSGGRKMSKSIGNVISPSELIEKYGTDATRYILLRHVHPTNDTDITWERMDEWYTANLVNGLGNLVARVMTLSQKHLPSGQTDSIVHSTSGNIDNILETFDFQTAMNAVWGRIQKLDQEITETEPFRVVKLDLEKGKLLIEKQREELFVITQVLENFMPETSRIISNAIKENVKPNNLFPRLT